MALSPHVVPGISLHRRTVVQGFTSFQSRGHWLLTRHLTQEGSRHLQGGRKLPRFKHVSNSAVETQPTPYPCIQVCFVWVCYRRQVDSVWFSLYTTTAEMCRFLSASLRLKSSINTTPKTDVFVGWRCKVDEINTHDIFYIDVTIMNGIFRRL